MKWAQNKGADLPAIDFIPPGLEVEESNYVEWLLAGGQPVAEHHAHAWAETQPGTL